MRGLNNRLMPEPSSGLSQFLVSHHGALAAASFRRQKGMPGSVESHNLQK